MRLYRWYKPHLSVALHDLNLHLAYLLSSAAMMTAVDRHRKDAPESKKYYEKKRAEGKTHNQAIRTLGRHLCRVIFNLLTEDRMYELKN